MVNTPKADNKKQRTRSVTPETDSVATTVSSTRQSSPTGLRARKGEMFGTRKYTALPTNANGAPNRKRSGGGMSAWKRWLLVGGGVTFVVVALGGYHGATRSSGQNVGFEDDSES
jgi:hypothetical protein